MTDVVPIILAFAGITQTFNLFIAGILFKRLEQLDIALIKHIEKEIIREPRT